MEKLPSFGDKVTHLFTREKINEYIVNGGFHLNSWQNVQSVSDQSIYFAGNKITIQMFIDSFKDTKYQDLIINQQHVMDILTQLSVILDASSLNKLIPQIYQFINTLLNDEKKKISTTLLESMSSPATMAEHVRRVKTIKRDINPIIKCLLNLTSQSSSTTINADLKKAMRRNAIKANVDKVSSMTRKDVCDYIESIENWAIFGIDSHVLTDCMGQIRDKTFMDHLDSGFRITYPHQTCLTLDEVTISCLVDGSSGYDSHALAHNCTMAFPYSNTENTKSALPLPLIDDVINCHDISTISWTDMTQKESFATWRIMVKKILTEGRAGRVYSLSPSSPDMSFLIIKMIFDSMESLTRNISTKPSFDDTNAVIMRGLFGLLFTTMACGSVPVCDVYRMTTCLDGDCVKISKNHMWMIPKILNYLSYTGWDITKFKNNARKICFTTVFKAFSNRDTYKFAVKTLETTKSYQITKINQNSSLTTRQRKIELNKIYTQFKTQETKVMYIICKVLQGIDYSDSPAVHQKLRDFIFENKIYSYSKDRFRRKLINYVIQKDCVDTTDITTIVDTMLAKYSTMGTFGNAESIITSIINGTYQNTTTSSTFCSAISSFFGGAAASPTSPTFGSTLTMYHPDITELNTIFMRVLGLSQKKTNEILNIFTYRHIEMMVDSVPSAKGNVMWFIQSKYKFF
jgi:hypothetical protein